MTTSAHEAVNAAALPATYRPLAHQQAASLVKRQLPRRGERRHVLLAQKERALHAFGRRQRGSFVSGGATEIVGDRSHAHSIGRSRGWDAGSEDPAYGRTRGEAMPSGLLPDP